MKPDLHSLEITEKEIKRLSGAKVSKQFRIGIWGTLLRTFLLWLLIIITAVIFSDLKLVPSTELLPGIALLSMFTAPFAAMVIPNLQFKPQQTETNAKLVEEVQKINSIIKAIDVNDQLVEAGNKGMSVSERDKTIEALRLAKEDLVRALKTEKILRENKDIIANNSELLTNNLSNLRALQVSEQATDFGNILSKTLQIAVDVQAEMNQLVTESGVKSA